MVKNLLQRIIRQINGEHGLGRLEKCLGVVAVFNDRLFHLFIVLVELFFFIPSSFPIGAEPLKAHQKMVQSAVLGRVVE